MGKEKNEWLGFYKQYKLHQACANDGFRPAMEHIQFKNGYAYASDGHIAVKANLTAISALSPEDIEKLNGHYIHSSQWPLLLKYSNIEIGEGVINLIGENGVKTVITLRDEVNGITKFPDIEKLFAPEKIDKEASLHAVGFSFKLLNKLRAAMGLSDKTVLRFTGYAADPIYVKGELSKFTDVQGLIMPMLLDD